MNDGFDLGLFLQKARAEGKQDSEGNFTVAQDKALDKLAHFSLAGEYDWVLKVVQAVNAWDCPLLQVNQTRVATSFYFRPPDTKFPSDAEIVGALRHGSAPQAGGTHELCVALRALVDQAKLSFVLTTRYEGNLGEPIYSGDDVSSLSDRVRRKWSHLEKDGMRLTVSHFRGNESKTGRYIPTFSMVAQRNVEIAEVLEKRAFCSPATIFLDGRDITNPFFHPSYGGTVYYRPLALGYEGKTEEEMPFIMQPYPALTDWQQLRRPKALKDRSRAWLIIQTMDWLALEEARTAAQNPFSAADLEPPKHRQHLIFWLRYGVVCECEALFKGGSQTTAFLFLPADEEPTDLTGLSLGLEGTEPRIYKFIDQVRDSLMTFEQKLDFFTSRIAPQAIIPFQGSGEEEELTKLNAGFSIFTEGLVSGESALVMLSKELHKIWRSLRALPRKKKLVENWGEFVIQESKRLRLDLSGERRRTHL